MRTEVRLSVRGDEGMVVGLVHCPLDKFGSKRIINSKERYELRASFFSVREHRKIFVDCDNRTTGNQYSFRRIRK